MGYKDHLDPHSQMFHHNWTRPKRVNTQVNGHTQISQSVIRTLSDAKARRMF
jgi:hypothetical protein